MGSDEYTRDLDPTMNAGDEYVKDMEGHYIYPLSSPHWVEEDDGEDEEDESDDG